MKSHINGTLETVRHAKRRAKYHENLAKIMDLGYEKQDLLHYFPSFVGDLTLARAFTLYEFYKQTKDIAGHICEVGVHKGFGSILFGKLIQLFEPHSLTMVHGFDWFKGIEQETDAKLQRPGGDGSDEDMLRELIRLQNLDSVVKVHNLDVRTDLSKFFEDYPHLRFRLAFIDSGTYAVTKAAIESIWPRLNKGGIMIFDQYTNEVAPGETQAIHELLPNETIRNIGGWMANSYILKGGS